MANSRAGEVALRHGSSPKCKWIFSKEEMLNMASLRDGMDEFKELQFRQQSTKFIQLLGDRLNHQLRDHRGKITQLCMCAAMIHMHRFFYFHSFTFFDYRDVAAACLFLSGKSEECPRKIDHIVKAWWSEKFPGIKLDQQKYDDAMGLLVAIESVILQTIAFDLQVSLPHPLVLKAMHAIAKSNRKITEVVYFFSTDVLCVTSWGIRYSAEAIAVACVHIVCAWANFEMPVSVDGSKWYHKMDPTMTEDQLQDMMREFITVYRTCKDDLAITKFIRKGEIRDPISSDGETERATPPALMMDPNEMRLPPPPPPPLSLASKKVDINAYKERRAADGGSSGGNSSSHHHSGPSPHSTAHQQHSQQRRNFMPDVNTVKGVTASMPGFVLPKQETVDRKPEIKQEIKQEEPYSQRSSSSSHRPTRPPSNGSSGVPPSQHRPSYQNAYMQQQPSGSGNGDHRSMERSGMTMGGERGRDAERERNEKRKREMSSSNLNSEKRSRTDMPMASMGGQPQRVHSMPSSQQQSHGYNSVPPPPLMQQTLPSHYGNNSNKHYSGGHSMSNGHHHQQQPPPQRQSYSQGGSSGYGGGQAPGYGSHHGHHMQNGYGGLPPPPAPPTMATTGNDMEDGEVF